MVGYQLDDEQNLYIGNGLEIAISIPFYSQNCLALEFQAQENNKKQEGFFGVGILGDEILPSFYVIFSTSSMRNHVFF